MATTSTSLTIGGVHGPIAATSWPGDGRPVVAVHGVNGSADAWSAVAVGLGGSRPMMALDLRGRGRSPATGPWGVSAHADDVTAALSDLGEPATVVGHSFGAHIAAIVARRWPDLVADLVLVDGGPPRTVPPDSTTDRLIAEALANILPRLADLPFPVSSTAVEADFASMVVDDESITSLTATTQPLHLVRAGHGVMPGTPPIIDDGVVAEIRRHRDLTDDVVDDATHFSLLTDHVAAVVAALTTEADR